MFPSRTFLLCWLIFFPSRILVTAFFLVSDISGCPCDVKENVIRQTRPPSSTASLSSSDAHMPIVGAFTGGQGSASYSDYAASMQPQKQQVVCSDALLSYPALTSSTVCATEEISALTH